MNTTLNSILFSILITVTPIFYAYYKGDKSSCLKVSIWTVISFIISIILFNLVTMNFKLPHLL